MFFINVLRFTFTTIGTRDLPRYDHFKLFYYFFPFLFFFRSFSLLTVANKKGQNIKTRNVSKTTFLRAVSPIPWENGVTFVAAGNSEYVMESAHARFYSRVVKYNKTNERGFASE